MLAVFSRNVVGGSLAIRAGSIYAPFFRPLSDLRIRGLSSIGNIRQSKLMRRTIVQTAVRSFVVVFNPPRRDSAACVPEIAEPARVQALVAKAPVEAFDESILDWFAGFDVIEFDSMVDSPGEEVTTGQFAAVIHAYSLRPAATGDHPIESARYAAARQ